MSAPKSPNHNQTAYAVEPERLTDMEKVLSLIGWVSAPTVPDVAFTPHYGLVGVSIEFAEMVLENLENPFAKRLLANAIEQERRKPAFTPSKT